MGEIFKRVTPNRAQNFTGERLTSSIGGQIELEHFHRYFFARELARGRAVLDIACGEGYGSAYLSQVAASVVGVDIDPATVEHAQANYGRDNIEFRAGSTLEIPLPDASVDLVVSFETIEHFYDHDTFLREVKRVLKPGGLFMVSTPERDLYSPPNTDSNPYHVHEMTRAEFQRLLDRHFGHVELLLQRVMLGSVLVQEEGEGSGPGEALTIERRGNDLFEVSRGMPRAPYILAVASTEALPDLGPSFYIINGFAELDDVRLTELEHKLAAAATKQVTTEGALAAAAARIDEISDALAEAVVREAKAAARLQRYRDKPFKAGAKFLWSGISRLWRRK